MESQTHYLNNDEELRVEVKLGTVVTATLVDGAAEIFGAELPKKTPTTLPGGKHAIFSWRGATIEIAGETEMTYTANASAPMTAYLNVDGVLQRRREAARAAGTPGPRVALVGPTDVGKSSVAKILCNYAQARWTPTFSDLDLGQGGITCPATIGAVPIDRPIDACEGLPLEMPLVYFHGDVSPGNNPTLYKALDRMGEMLRARDETNAAAAASGVVVNTMGWIDKAGYGLLLHALEALAIDVVLVVDHEKLHAELSRDLRGKKIKVWKLQKSGGVVERTPEFRRRSRDARVREYFYGPLGDLSPHSQTLEFGKVSIFKIGAGPSAPRSALPIGQESSADPLRVSTVAPSMSLLNAVLGVSHGKTQAELLSSNVAGFIFVTDVDVANGRFTYLTPCPGELPSRNLIAGTLKWIETR
ncbi:pre-mrna cleavage complex family protein [Micromonas pusilla CCMP1545]|uniref:Protein CLP1 homolog n=1 Tax=Micromonas pusilla (strain CCMP1545) TaxID=564608 RepID=C1N970_MICPC|nr:pre-mrna cleavage complex family protein [Micromonas pusilla CCMP1545]EEH51471.1 pre-mrna cleavage complex family protein [Micromonas pusilla CCMP1545]|eukprot:XP_003064566.1 pre-mrna cleavage complex family protein [Micromonas pusilla CCMP1545]